MSAYYYVVIKNGAVIDCTTDAPTAVERFLSRGADRMEKVSSLKDVQRICNAEGTIAILDSLAGDGEQGMDPEAQISNLWSYLCEGVERLGKRIKETESVDVQEAIERAIEKVRETGHQGITELRELLDKLRPQKPKPPKNVHIRDYQTEEEANDK